MAVVAVLERHAPKDTTLAHLLRCLCFYAALFRFEFSEASTAFPPKLELSGVDKLVRQLFADGLSSSTTSPHTVLA